MSVLDLKIYQARGLESFVEPERKRPLVFSNHSAAEQLFTHHNLIVV